MFFTFKEKQHRTSALTRPLNPEKQIRLNGIILRLINIRRYSVCSGAQPYFEVEVWLGLP